MTQFLVSADAPTRSSGVGVIAAGAAAKNVRDFLATFGGDIARACLSLERINRRTDHVVRVRGAERFCNDVLNAERLEHGSHRSAGDDSGSRRRRAENNFAGAPTARRIMMQRTALAERNANETALGLLRRLADCLRHFARLAFPIADAALLVAYHDESCKTEVLSALNDLSDAIDRNELVDEFVALFALRSSAAAASLPIAAIATLVSVFARHSFLHQLLKIETGFTSRVSERFDTPMKDVTAAIEDNVLDAGFDRTFRKRLADLGSGSLVGAFGDLALEILVER